MITIYALMFHCGAIYIGRTKNPGLRRSSHFSLCRAGKHYCKRVQAAWDAQKSAQFAILETADEKNAQALEQKWIGSVHPCNLVNQRRAEKMKPLPTKAMRRAMSQRAIESNAADYLRNCVIDWEERNKRRREQCWRVADSCTGQIFANQFVAAAYFGVTPSCVRGCCSRNKPMTVKGRRLHWAHKDPWPIKERPKQDRTKWKKAVFSNEERAARSERNRLRGRHVFNETTQKGYISLREAARQTGGSRPCIVASCDLPGRLYKGQQWRWL